jgi:hypothetical protein
MSKIYKSISLLPSIPLLSQKLDKQKKKKRYMTHGILNISIKNPKKKKK